MANFVDYVIQLKDRFTTPLQKASKGVDELEKRVNKLEQRSSKAGGSGGGLGAMFGGFAGLAAGAVIAAGAAGAAIINMGANMEQTRVRFETFLNSAEKGNALIADLQKFSQVTPFKDAEVIQAGQQLLAFGVEADDITNKLNTLGNISSATGKNFNELASIYGKNKLSGVIQAEDLNQLVESGIPVMESFAKQLGVSTAEVKKMGSEGKISFAMLETAFEELGGAGGKWGDMMDKQSKTFSGRMSTMLGVAEGLGASLGEAVLPFFGKFVDAGVTLVNFISNNKAAIGSMFAPLVDAFSPLFDSFDEVLEVFGITSDSGSFLETVFNGIGTAIAFISPLIKVLAEAIGFVYVKVAEVVKAFADWYQRTEWVQKGVQFLYVSITSVFNKVVDKATSTFGAVADIITSVFNGDWDKLSLSVDKLAGEVFESPIDVGRQLAEDIAKGMEEPFGGLNFFDKSNSAIADAANGGTTGNTGTPTTPAGNKATDAKLSDAIGSVTGSKSNTYNFNIDKLIENYTNHFTNVKEATDDVKRQVLNAVLSGVSDVTTNLSN